MAVQVGDRTHSRLRIMRRVHGNDNGVQALQQICSAYCGRAAVGANSIAANGG